jgi:hypothetical protein
MELIRASGSDFPVNRINDSRRNNISILGSGSDLSIFKIT